MVQRADSQALNIQVEKPLLADFRAAADARACTQRAAVHEALRVWTLFPDLISEARKRIELAP